MYLDVLVTAVSVSGRFVLRSTCFDSAVVGSFPGQQSVVRHLAGVQFSVVSPILLAPHTDRLFLATINSSSLDRGLPDSYPLWYGPAGAQLGR